MRSENDPGGQNIAGSGEGQPGARERSFIEKARRAQIIEAAVEVIATRGFAKASLAQIAAHAGVSKGVISYHFAGKSELIERLVEHIYVQIGSLVGSRVAEHTDTAEWLRIHARTVAEYMGAHRTRLAAINEIVSSFRTEDGVLRYGILSNEPLYAEMENRFRAGQERGELRDFDVRVMAVSLQSAIDHMFACWMAYPDHDLLAHADEVAELFVHATRSERAL